VEALHDKRAESIIPATPTTIPMILGDPVVATTMPIPAENPRLLTPNPQKGTVSVPTTQIGTALSIVREPSTTTSKTTTVGRKTPLEVAQAEVGKTGPYADGGFWCAKFASFVAEKAEVPQFKGSDSPARLHADAVADGRFTDTPVIGGLVFIDLFGPGGVGHGQVTHVAILESVEGDELHIIQGNGDPDRSVVTRTTYRNGDGFVIGFAPFTARRVHASSVVSRSSGCSSASGTTVAGITSGGCRSVPTPTRRAE
jgi:hypothetical protein